jgi:hypothetical protein
VIVRGRQQAGVARRAVAPGAAVELRGHDEFFIRHEGGAGRHDGGKVERAHLPAPVRGMRADAQAQRFLVGAQPVEDARGLALAHARHAHPPARTALVDVRDQHGQARQAAALQARGDSGVEPGRDAVARARVLRREAFEPAQRIELPLDDAGAPGCTPGCVRAAAGAAAGTACRLRIGGFVGLDLLGFGEVFEALRVGEVTEARQRRGGGKLLGVEQDQPRGAGALLAARGGGELVADPRDGAAHDPQVGVLALEPEVAVPAGALVDALGHGPHEGEVAAVEFAGLRLAHGAGKRGALPGFYAQNFHHGRIGTGSGGGACSGADACRMRRRTSTSSACAVP